MSDNSPSSTTNPARTPRLPWAERRGVRGVLGAIWDAYPHPMWVFMIGIVVSAAAAGVAGIWVSGLRGMESLGVLVWMLGFFAWVVVHDAKKRWPHLSAWKRYVAAVTMDGHHQDRAARAWRAAQTSGDGSTVGGNG